MCGAPASTDSPACEHCGARLATVACPSCFGMVFQGAKFCSHCGALAVRTEVSETAKQLCPRCQVDLQAVVVGKTNLRECLKCEGVWLAQAEFEQICADTEKQSAVLGMAAPLPAALTGNVETDIRYRPCPVCRKLMNRVNFARCSHVVVDVCAQHGTWFDQDELRRIVEFIHGGGLAKARTLEEEEAKRRLQRLEDQRRNLSGEHAPAGWNAGSSPVGPTNWPIDKLDVWETVIGAAAGALFALLRK